MNDTKYNYSNIISDITIILLTVNLILGHQHVHYLCPYSLIINFFAASITFAIYMARYIYKMIIVPVTVLIVNKCEHKNLLPGPN